MGYFSEVTKVIPIDTDDLKTAKNKVTIRRLNFAQRQACISIATTVTTTANVSAGKGKSRQAALSEEREASVVVDGALMAMEQLKASIVSWEGPDFEGMPATPEYIGKLPPWLADKLSVEVDALNNSLSEDEKKA